jgi:hypothetical protein
LINDPKSILSRKFNVPLNIINTNTVKSLIYAMYTPVLIGENPPGTRVLKFKETNGTAQPFLAGNQNHRASLIQIVTDL